MIDTQTLDDLVRFHGHMCAGLALGARAAQIAMRELAPDAGLVAAVETHTCSVDAIQVLTGCTSGNGKLYFRDYAKNAYTFWPSDGAALRIVAAPDSSRGEEFWDTFAKVQAGTASDAERAAFFAAQQEASRRTLEAPEEELFAVDRLALPPPSRTAISRPETCHACGEASVRPWMSERDGRLLCVPCAEPPLLVGRAG